MTWTIRTDPIEIHAIRFVVECHAQPVSYGEVIRAWRDDSAFRSYFNSALAECSLEAFRWETPSVTIATANRRFEFVLVASPDLSRTPDRTVFSEHFKAAKSSVAVFSNLGGDATMVVPCPLGDSSAFGHLGAFVRRAPESQRDALWQAVGAAMADRLGDKPVWLSTAGAGVAWLHVRLDDRPKYYHFQPYR